MASDFASCKRCPADCILRADAGHRQRPPFANFKQANGDFFSTDSTLSFRQNGRLPKWPTGADCKSAGLRLRWFESITYHHSLLNPMKSMLPLGFKISTHTTIFPPHAALAIWE